MKDDLNQCLNKYGQPVGEDLIGWASRPRPTDVVLQGTFCRLEPLDFEMHGDDLYAAYSSAADARDWTYMFAGPFSSVSEYRDHVESIVNRADLKTYAILDRATGRAAGTFALARIDSDNGVIEVGNVTFSSLLKQRAAATEAQYLLMKYVFDDLKYRRYEWKCDSLNASSRKAALRLGFVFEGIFRQAVIYRGRSRDTSWYSMTDKEWPFLKKSFEAWLRPENFDRDGRQIRSLNEFKSGFGDFTRS